MLPVPGPPRRARALPSALLALGVAAATAGCDGGAGDAAAERPAVADEARARARRLVAEGRALLARGEEAPAVPLLEEARRLDPENGWAPFHLGLADYERRHVPLGALFVDRGRVERALERFREAVALDPAEPAFRLYEGLALQSLLRNEEAADALGEAARLDPANSEALVVLGAVQASLGRLEEARSTLERALEANPLAVDANRELGGVYLELGEWSAARSAFQRVARHAPHVPEGWLGLARAERRLGRDDEADTALDRWRETRDVELRAEAARAELDPDVLALFEEGQARLRAGDHAAALERFRAMAAADPGSGLARAHVGLVRLQQGDAAAATEELEAAVALAPALGFAWLQLGRARRAAADGGGATAALERAVELDPESVAARLELGRTYAAAGRADEAADQARAVLALEPRSRAARELLAGGGR